MPTTSQPADLPQGASLPDARASGRALGHTDWPEGLAIPPKYEPLRLLGSGSMGTVVLARDRGLGRCVAFKVLNASCEVFLARFDVEARVMARLDHPAIVRVHEYDTFEERVYLAMEYMPGGSLAAARSSPRELVSTLRPVVDALSHAHDHGVVHRDIKPENILLDGRGGAHLADFGLAYDGDEGPERTPERPVLGTPLTMAPEQARGEEVGPATDVFAFGVTLYRLLTGEWPHRGRSLPEVLEAIQHVAPMSLRVLRPDVTRSLDETVMRCLQKDPPDRFSSMDALGASLDRCLRGGILRRLLGR